MKIDNILNLANRNNAGGKGRRDKNRVLTMSVLAATLVMIALVMVTAVSCGRKEAPAVTVPGGTTWEQQPEKPSQTEAIGQATAETEDKTAQPEDDAAKEDVASGTQSEIQSETPADEPADGKEGGETAAPEKPQQDKPVKETKPEQPAAQEKTPAQLTEKERADKLKKGATPMEIKGYASKDGFTEDKLLATLVDYWQKGNETAVEDLTALPRYKAMSASLKDAQYYYFGQRDAAGLPNGKGVMVYAGNRYYYGDFKNGKKDGQGTFVRLYLSENTGSLFPADESLQRYSYSGSFKNDLPSGEGQEQFLRKEGAFSVNGAYIRNIIGGFKEGLYNGDMYIMTGNRQNVEVEWKGKAKSGAFETLEGRDKANHVPVCYDVKNEDSHLWVDPAKNRQLGCTELRYLAGLSLSDAEISRVIGEPIDK